MNFVNEVYRNYLINSMREMSDFERLGKDEFLKELLEEFDLDYSEEAFSKYKVLLKKLLKILV